MVGYLTNPGIIELDAKSSYDLEPFWWDFSNVLQPGDTIATLASLTAMPSGLTIGTSGITSGMGGSGMAVSATLGSGANNLYYQVTAQIITASGYQYSRSLAFPLAVL